MTQTKQISKTKKVILLSLTSVLFYSCAPSHSESVEKAATEISANLGCSNVQSKVFDSFYALIDQEQYIPSAASLNASLDAKVDEIVAHKNLTSDEKEKISALKTELHNLVETMLSEASGNSQLTAKEQIQKLIEYEMGDQSDVTTIEATQKIALTADKVKTLSQSLEMACAPSTESAATSGSNASLSSLPAGKMTTGINMVFSTAYQSCRVLDLPPIERSTASVVGITRVGTHEDGIGGKREVTSLSSVQKTHYYINGIATESQCFAVRNNPLIYDYGGSPAVSGTTINFQKNAGSGTGALGVDCSAYVSSAIAVGGLRYKPATDNKPIYIRQTSSKFIDAAKSGFTCFENVTVTPAASVKAGDIVGVSGHVVAVDSVGADPFGLALIKTEAGCSNISYKNFDITITQSSPSKNGIGINKYLVKDYLLESGDSGKMTVAFVGMAKQACLAKFQNKSIKPASSAWGFLRHKGTAECLAPRVSMVGEACTQKCF